MLLAHLLYLSVVDGLRRKEDLAVCLSNLVEILLLNSSKLHSMLFHEQTPWSSLSYIILVIISPRHLESLYVILINSLVSYLSSFTYLQMRTAKPF